MNQSSIPFYGVDRPYELIYRKNATKYPVSVHMHNVTEIYFTLSDLPDVLLDDEVMSVKKGTIIFIPPFCPHQLFHEKEVVYERFILNVDTKWLDNVMSYFKNELLFLRGNEKKIIRITDDVIIQKIRASFDKFLEFSQREDSKGISEFFSLIDELDRISVMSESGESSEKQPITEEQKRINDIISYINSHLSDKTTLKEIAEHFYLNKDYLSRLFMKHTHTTIGQYMIIQRIARAQNLLREGKTVPEVQELLGYSSYAYFFNSFKKITGVSPSKYRLQYREND